MYKIYIFYILDIYIQLTHFTYLVFLDHKYLTDIFFIIKVFMWKWTGSVFFDGSGAWSGWLILYGSDQIQRRNTGLLLDFFNRVEFFLTVN